MLVVEKAKALALKLNNPARVLETIPTAKTLSVQGQDIVVIPHKLDETRVLKNLGINVPSPILHYYNWSGRYTPYEHQKQTAAFLTTHPRALVLNSIGTGKTSSALWAADYLIQMGAVKKVLIVSPLSTLERVWGDAVFMDFPHRKAVTLHGTSKRRKKLLDTEADFYIINHDGLPVLADQIDGRFDLVIVDEAAILRNPSTQRYRIMQKYMSKNPTTRLWLLTGTPTPNEPTDAWTLAKLVDSPFVTKTYTAFRELVMSKIGMYKWVPRPDAAEHVHRVLYPAVRYTREECFDLPDTIVQTRKVDLTPIQKTHYQNMIRDLITESQNGGVITAANEAVKMQKLIQIACGVAYGDEGQHIELDCSPRIDVVKELIEETGEKVIVFVPLTGTLKLLERELSKRWTVGVVNGAVSASKRNEIFHNFQHARDPKILIAHPATMAHGLTLTSASTLIWYGPITSNEQYTQANGRVERIGKRHISNVIHIESTELEHKIYKRLEGKQKLQGVLLDLIQQQTGGDNV